MARFGKAGDVRVGVIGYGGAFNMGRGHLNEMKGAGMTPTAVAEIDKSRLKAAEQDFPGIETYSTVSAMLKKSDVNLVTIITPHNTHAKLALQCLREGRHVVCEKPFAITTAECDAMIAEAKRRSLVLSCYHNRHWDGCILEAIDRIVRQKAIGDVFRIEAHMAGFYQPGNWWRTSKSISGGVLYDWGVHLLEYSLQLMNSEVLEVTSYAKTGVWADRTAWKKDTNEDEAFAVVRFRNGGWVSLCISALDSNPKRGWLEITGTKGSYIMEGGSYEVINKVNGQTISTKGQNMPGQGDKFYKNIAAHLVKGTKLIITPEWARRPIHILNLADMSARKGTAMKAKYG